MAKATTGKIDVALTNDTIEMLRAFSAQIDQLAHILTPSIQAKTTNEASATEQLRRGRDYVQDHYGEATEQATPAPMREELPDRFRRRMSSLEGEASMMKDQRNRARWQRDKAQTDAMNVRGELADCQTSLAAARRQLVTLEALDDDVVAAATEPLRERIEELEVRDRYTTSALNDAQETVRQLRASIAGDGNVLEANAQLRAENAALVAQLEDMRGLVIRSDRALAELRKDGRTVTVDHLRKQRTEDQQTITILEGQLVEVHDLLRDALDEQYGPNITRLADERNDAQKQLKEAREGWRRADEQLAQLKERRAAADRTYQKVLAERDALEAERDDLERQLNVLRDEVTDRGLKSDPPVPREPF